MKRLLLALAAGGALAYGAYRYFGVVPDLRVKEVEQAKTTLDRVNVQAGEIEKALQQRADQAAKSEPR